jgi:hypothetical protein
MKRSKLRNIIREVIRKTIVKDRVFDAPLLNEAPLPCNSGCCRLQALKVNCPNGNPPGCGGSNATFGGWQSKCNFIDGNPPVVGDEFIVPSNIGGIGNCLYKVVAVHENGPKPSNVNYISGVCPPPPPSWNCVSPGNCQDPGDGSGTYPSLAACNTACPTGCSSGTFPSFNFTNNCDANASYLTWPSNYNPPAGSNQFTWYGGTITHPWNQSTVTNGDMLDNALVNMVLANQGSYCEWCDDFANNGVNYGGVGNSPQFDDYVTPLWHTPVPLGGPWSPTTGITPPEAHCCCCPGQGGGPMNPGAGLLAKMGGSDDELIDPSDLEPSTHDDTCCDWCATVNPNIPSKPPVGCEDWMCDNCPGFKPKPTIIPENLKRQLQIRAGIIK